MQSSWLVALLFLVPAAGAQALVTDAAGDPTFQVGGTQEMDAPRGEYLDLLALRVEEAARDIVFHIDVAALDDPNEQLALMDSPLYAVAFTFAGIPHRAMVSVSGFEPIESTWFMSAWLDRVDPVAGHVQRVARLDSVLDVADATVSVVVPKTFVTDAAGRMPRLGDTLEDISVHVAADMQVEQSILWSGQDRAPDNAADDARFELAYGLADAGHAVLDCADPIRFSNGEATTFLFEVQATNLADHLDTFALSVDDVPDNWVITFPEQEIRIGAGQSIDVPILVTTPFVHSHGTYHPLRVEMQSLRDPETKGLEEIGVLYPAVPQPAGHHDTLWLHHHPMPRGQVGTMSTLQEVPEATGEQAKAGQLTMAESRLVHTFRYDLSPALRIGLDVDTEDVGHMEVSLVAERLSADVQVQALVVVTGPGTAMPDEVFLADTSAATIVASEPEFVGTVQPQQRIDLEFDLLPTGVGDHLSPDKIGAMSLFVTFSELVPDTLGYTRISADELSPFILPGGTLRLPLDEYHDVVEPYFQALSGVELRAAGEQRRYVNPGETVVFEVEAHNLGTSALDLALSLTGSNLEWARILGATSIQVAPDGARILAVEVRAPDSAADGELVDLTLHAVVPDDENSRSLIRLIAEVDTEEDHPDEAEHAAGLEGRLGNQQAPGLPVTVLLVAFALAVRRIE